jgi:polyketide cyclase/dehydrase/lipid transport protein
MGEQVSVALDMAAPPETVYEMVSDVTRMGEWSPECVRCEWIGDGRKKFRGHNREGGHRWSTTATVVADEPGREFAFDVTTVFSQPVARWSYRFEPVDGGSTRVTESWEDRRPGWLARLGGIVTGVSDRAEHNRRGMAETLTRIKAVAER